ncbi:hypothetical protein L593_04955 [Salinarchaeum sp. Harcht-Bsk1]|nr:hypothetical protein L593_04955 [Salinarchaeum sp. Harcht-Bsk1]
MWLHEMNDKSLLRILFGSFESCLNDILREDGPLFVVKRHLPEWYDIVERVTSHFRSMRIRRNHNRITKFVIREIPACPLARVAP